MERDQAELGEFGGGSGFVGFEEEVEHFLNFDYYNVQTSQIIFKFNHKYIHRHIIAVYKHLCSTFKNNSK